MTEPAYLSGFGNEFATEAVPGALPRGQNSPQEAPLGLYAEQLSGTPFTAPRAENRRSWFYRIRPSAMHPPFRRIDDGLLRSGPFDEIAPSPNRLRWDPLPMPQGPTDFIDGLVTVCGTGDVARREGLGIHHYLANRSMAASQIFVDADGELLFVPQEGRVRLVTELGVVEAGPGMIAVVPRGVKFRVELAVGAARGYLAENYGAFLRLPELGPLAPTASPIRGISRRPWPLSRTATRLARWCRNSQGTSGRRILGIALSMSSPGTAMTRPTATIWRATTPSTP